MSDARSRGDEAPQVGGALGLVLEVLEAIPKLAERTRAQADLSRTLLAHMPCVGAWFRSDVDVPVPAHEARQPTDVLSVVALRDDEAGPGDHPTVAAPAGSAPTGSAPTGAPAVSGTPVSATPVSATPVPEASSLAIPDYDSLAASQVVPRLTTLSPGELRQVGAYEESNRHRQTILNRVAQLLAD